MSQPADNLANTREYNFDGLVGLTHNYAGLARGNLASDRHRAQVSNPQAAALEGLAKMKLLLDLGIPQGIIPPLARPDIDALRRLGFTGSSATVLARASREAPHLLAACGSAAAMWTANAATVSPAADTADRHVHLTPANLTSQLHRSLETNQVAAILRRIFPALSPSSSDPINAADFFVHHDSLPASAACSDEGAANHLRLTPAHGQSGIEIFVYGRGGDHNDEVGEGNTGGDQSRRFPARQTFEASAAVARGHLLDPARVLFVRQAPEAIDAGVFHNDVIAVANENVLLIHEAAWVEQEKILTKLRTAWQAVASSGSSDRKLFIITVAAAELSLAEAVRTYLFNSQLLTLPDGSLLLLAPEDCRESKTARRVIENILAGDNPVTRVQYLNLRQSMQNGGGPACLRLRVVLTEAAAARVHPGVILTPELYATLTAWVKKHYRDNLTPSDLADPQLLNESCAALDELTRILDLPELYPFQLV